MSTTCGCCELNQCLQTKYRWSKLLNLKSIFLHATFIYSSKKKSDRISFLKTSEFASCPSAATCWPQAMATELPASWAQRRATVTVTRHAHSSPPVGGQDGRSHGDLPPLVGWDCTCPPASRPTVIGYFNHAHRFIFTPPPPKKKPHKKDQIRPNGH